MSRYIPSAELHQRAARGDMLAISRLISRAESGDPESRETFAAIYREAGRAHIIGLTGVPGSGKSTLVAALAARLRLSGRKIGVVAVDPSSPYSGGAILGDRIRMTELARDPGVFIRSMATRGAMGGMARATLEAVDVLDIAGFETVIIETVGVGQDEVDIARASHTTVVVSAPGLGDDIQAIKAGMLEIADIHVVSKCDRSDAHRTLADIKQMLTFAAAAPAQRHWRTPVIGVSSMTGEGIDELTNSLADHHDRVAGTPHGLSRQLSIADFRLRKTAETLLFEKLAAAAASIASSLAARLQNRESDPYTLANELLAATLQQDACHD